MIASNPHTHTIFCDGHDTVDEMCLRAIELGFVSLGFSGHSYHERDARFCMLDTPGYQAAVRAAKEKYAGKLKVYLGVEWDALSELDPNEFDYTLGAAHRVMIGSRDVAVDGDPDELAISFDEIFHGDGLAMTGAYYDCVAQFARAHKTDVFAHFDLVRKYNGGNRFFDETDPAYRKRALRALEAVFESGAILEINTGAMARGITSDPYPSMFLLRPWREMGGKVIVGSDCHFRQKLHYAFDVALETARKAGFETVSRLGAGDALFDELEIESELRKG